MTAPAHAYQFGRLESPQATRRVGTEGRHALTSRRSGQTLIELIVALAITGLLAAGVMRTVVTSLRFLEATARTSEQRSQLDAAAVIAAGLLRDLAPPLGDIVTHGDSAFDIRGTLGASIACAVSGSTAELPPSSIVGNSALTGFVDAIQPGDIASRWEQGATTASTDDSWIDHRVLAVRRSRGGCAGSPHSTPASPTSPPGWSIDLAPALPDTVGAIPLRFLRPQRLALYRSGTDWSLGWTEWNATAARWNVIQPAVGPLSGYHRGVGGLTLEWYDSTFSPARRAVDVVSIAGMVRAPTARPVQALGRPPGALVDSLGFRIALRNRP